MNYLPDYRNPCWHAKVPEESLTKNPYVANPYTKLAPKMAEESWRIVGKKQAQGDLYRTRCLPLVYLIGVTKSGTTDLFDNIVRHHEMAAPSMKEPMWWNRHTIG
jgi:N-acetylgalactosamine 4-sulfate 6-O-sulfotransferase